MKRFLNMVADIFYPRCCPVCQKILADQRRMICPECEKELRPIGHPRCYKCGKPIETGFLRQSNVSICTERIAGMEAGSDRAGSGTQVEGAAERF